MWAVYNEETVVTHTVSFDARDGEPKPNPFSVEVKDGELVEKPAVDPQVEGKVFDGWYSPDGKFDFAEPVKKSYKLWAVYNEETVVTHTVSFDARDGEPKPDPFSVEVKEANQSQIPKKWRRVIKLLNLWMTQ